MKVLLKNGQKIDMTYDDVCEALGGYIPGVHFVRVTTRGTISFTVGKPEEVRALLCNTIENGFVPARKLMDVASY